MQPKFLLWTIALFLILEVDAKKPANLTPEIVKNVSEIVKNWQRDFSGIPAQCVRGQFLFSGDILIETPNETISGLNRFYPYCEANWQEKFKQIEIFVTGPILFSDVNQVSFTRTILYLTHMNCRLSVSGITMFEINEVNKVKRWREHYDLDQFTKDLKACSLDFEEESETATLASAKCDFAATAPNTLSFKKGDSMVVVRDPSSAWWMAEINGKQDFVVPFLPKQNFQMQSLMKPVRPTIALIGEVSAGKSTFLNAWFVCQFSKMSKLRTTMAPSVFIENMTYKGQNSPFVDIFRAILDRDERLYKQKDKADVAGNVLGFEVAPLPTGSNKKGDIEFAIVDLPGLNDESTDKKILGWIEKNCQFIDMYVFIIDGDRGMNTKSEKDILRTIVKNIRDDKQKYEKDTALICIFNKYDNPENEETNQMKDQAAQSVKAETKGIPFVAFLPMAAKKEYCYRMGQAKKLSHLPKDLIHELGVMEFGERKWREKKNKSEAEALEALEISISKQTGTTGGHWQQFEDALDEFIVKRMKQVFLGKVGYIISSFAGSSHAEYVQFFEKYSDQMMEVANRLDQTHMNIHDSVLTRLSNFTKMSRYSINVVTDAEYVSYLKRLWELPVWKLAPHESAFKVMEILVKACEFIITSTLTSTSFSTSALVTVVKPTLALLKKYGQELAQEKIIKILESIPQSFFENVIASHEIEKLFDEHQPFNIDGCLEIIKLKFKRLDFDYILSLKKLIAKFPIFREVEFMCSIEHYPLQGTKEKYLEHKYSQKYHYCEFKLLPK